MVKDLRIVLDTNLFVSILIAGTGPVQQAFDKAHLQYTLLYSDQSVQELEDVLGRPKFDRYATRATRQKFIELSFAGALRVEILEFVTDCIDPKDNKILELALNGRANLILTGDDHLLRLRPWRNLAILTPREFLDLAL